MKRFVLLMLVCFFVLPGMVYSAETQTRTWTDADGVTHVVTTTRERRKVTESEYNSEQGAAVNQGRQELQEQTIKEQATPEKTKTDKQEYRKTESDMPTGVNPKGSFQFDIDSHKPKF